jgi:hypothetical protein
MSFCGKVCFSDISAGGAEQTVFASDCSGLRNFTGEEPSMKKSVVTVLLAGAIAVSAAGCGNTAAGSAPSVESTAAKATEAASSSADRAEDSRSESAASSSSEASVSSESVSSSSQNSVTPEAEALTAVSVSSDDSAAALESSFGDVLNICTSWGPGTAGSSLQSVLSAVTLITWANTNDVKDMDQDQLLSVVMASIGKADDTEKEALAANWRTIYDTGDSILNDPTNLYGIMSDAGCYDEGVAIVQNADSAKNWETLKLLIERNAFE